MESFKTGQAVRGGVPICLPWFGVNQYDSRVQKHGFLRNQACRLVNISEDQEAVSLQFELHYQPNISDDRPPIFASEFRAIIGIHLSGASSNKESQAEVNITLRLDHLSQHKQAYSYALHSYFNVDNIASTTVAGLQQQNYLDNTQALQACQQHGDINFSGELDRVYPATQAPQILHSKHANLQIDADNAPTCVVWNPGRELAVNMPDIQQHYQNFVCIERGCAFHDEIILTSKESHTSSMTLSSL